MSTRKLASAVVAAALAAGCAPNPPTVALSPVPPPPVRAAPPAPASMISPVTLEGYKKLVASRIRSEERRVGKECRL